MHRDKFLAGSLDDTIAVLFISHFLDRAPTQQQFIAFARVKYTLS
jgi:hypothetical protein